MKCVSVPQPWAWAILAGLQKTDYRCYSTNHRGDLLILASRGAGDWDRRQLAVFGERAPRWEELLFGQVLGVVELWACEPGREGEWIWALRNPRPVKPFPLRPGKKLFDVAENQVHILDGSPTNGSKVRKK
jgi:hypothetical protein